MNPDGARQLAREANDKHFRLGLSSNPMDYVRGHGENLVPELAEALTSLNRHLDAARAEQKRLEREVADLRAWSVGVMQAADSLRGEREGLRDEIREALTYAPEYAPQPMYVVRSLRAALASPGGEDSGREDDLRSELGLLRRDLAAYHGLYAFDGAAPEEVWQLDTSEAVGRIDALIGREEG